MYNCMIGKSTFDDYKLRGYLKKSVKELKLFQTTMFPKRHFMIDFERAIVIIKNSETIHFRNF